MRPWTAHWVVRVLVAGASAISAAVVAAVVLTIADLYITGHGGASLSRPWISWDPVVDLSRAGVVFWFFTLISGAAAFFTTRGLLRPQAHQRIPDRHPTLATTVQHARQEVGSEMEANSVTNWRWPKPTWAETNSYADAIRTGAFFCVLIPALFVLSIVIAFILSGAVVFLLTMLLPAILRRLEANSPLLEWIDAMERKRFPLPITPYAWTRRRNS